MIDPTASEYIEDTLRNNPNFWTTEDRKIIEEWLNGSEVEHGAYIEETSLELAAARGTFERRTEL